MSIPFSDSVGNTGIVEQTRAIMRVDATQYPTYRIANSVNNWLDTVAGYVIGADRLFQWDDSNHTELPEGTTELTANVSDYSFLVDEQGNQILTLLGVSLLTNGKYVPLTPVDRDDPEIDLSSFGVDTGTPTQYDKIADNIIRLNKKPSATVSSGLKFYFQRTPSYFVDTDTTKKPGVPAILHRGFIIAAAYDGALALGLNNLQPLSVELQKEEQKLKRAFAIRNNDTKMRLTVTKQDNR